MSLDPSSNSKCCSVRPEKYRGAEVKDIPELCNLLEMHSVESQVIYYTCRICGQEWEEHLVPFMHADVFVVLKSGVKADLFLTESERIKYSSFKVETNLDKALYEDWNWSQWWIAGVGPMLGLIVGLATMPDLSHGISARETWVVVCMLGGFLAALALYGIVYGIISLLKRKTR